MISSERTTFRRAGTYFCLEGEGAALAGYAKSRIRDAVESLADFRHLTDAEAAKLLCQGGLIDEPVEWTVMRTRNDRPAEFRAKVAVENPSGERIFIGGRILIERLWASHWVLVWGDRRHHERSASIRRLDLRDDHVNPDGEVWDRQTHKHLWSVEDNNAVAYTPDDIPHDPSAPPVTQDDYRAIFEAFAAEVNVDLGPNYEWSDPPIEEFLDVDMRMWEVP